MFLKILNFIGVIIFLYMVIYGLVKMIFEYSKYKIEVHNKKFTDDVSDYDLYVRIEAKTLMKILSNPNATVGYSKYEDILNMTINQLKMINPKLYSITENYYHIFKNLSNIDNKYIGVKNIPYNIISESKFPNYNSSFYIIVHSKIAKHKFILIYDLERTNKLDDTN